MEGKDFHEKVVSASLRKYKELPRRGKPKRNEEWTPLSTVICSIGSELSVVSLGTGSKCIGKGKMSSEGWIVNDSHAEVIARRCFIRYLMHQIALATQGNESILDKVSTSTPEGELEVLYAPKPGVTFHFFSSQPPCGDASIFPMSLPLCDPSYAVSKSASGIKRRKLDVRQKDKISEIAVRLTGDTMSCLNEACTGEDTAATVNDTHRTGAKCVRGGVQDEKVAGPGYHTLGALRTKPGRGDPTSSMSCSDKLMRWSVLGCQGALLSHLLVSAVYLSSVTMCGELSSVTATRRALCERTESLLLSDAVKNGGYHVHRPEIAHVSHPPDELVEIWQEVTCLDDGLKRPAPGAICWCHNSTSPEVLVQGLRQGYDRRKGPTRAASGSICKRRLFEEFKGLFDNISSLPLSLRSDYGSYYGTKRASVKYWNARDEFLSFFPTWYTNDDGHRVTF